MRRSERITAVAGAVLVAASALGACVVLTLHGAAAASAAEAPAAGRDDVAPVDLAWFWFATCQIRVGESPMSGFSVGQDADGRLRVDMIDNQGMPIESAVAEELEGGINACLAEQRFEPLESRKDFWTGITAVDRLMLADAFSRRTAPCLLAHGLEPPVVHFEGYFDSEMAPWLDIYGVLVDPEDGKPASFDDVLEARRACGVPTDILARSWVGW